MSSHSGRRSGPRGSYHLQRSVLTAGLMAAALATSSPAAADTGHVEVIWLASPSIVVEGNGTAYYKMDPSSQNIDGKIRVELDAGVSGRVRSWEAWPMLRTVATDWKAFKGTGISRSKSYDSPRPKTVNEEFFFSIPWVHYAETAIAACNGQAAQLRGQGLSNGAIFSQDRSAKIEAEAGFSYDMSGVAGSDVPDEVGYALELTVTCKGVTPVANDPTRNKPDPQRTKPEVEQAVLTIHGEGSLHGACSINLSGVIETNLPNTQVKFRYHSDDGRKSELKTVQTDQSGTVIFNHEYPLSEGGTKSGKIRMVGEHPDFSSTWRNYQVNCGSPAQGYASNDPLPPTLTLNVAATHKETMYQGFICPAQVAMNGKIMAKDAYAGRAIFVAAQQGVAEPQQQVDEQKFDIVKGQHWAVGFEPEVRWSNVPVAGGNPPKQTMKLTFQVARHNKAVATVHKMLVLTCRKPQTTGVGGQAPAGGVTTGKPAPTHSQQQTAPARGLILPAPQKPREPGTN